MADGPSYGLLTTERELEERVSALISDGKPFGFDIETGYEGETREEAQLHPEENFIAGLSLTNSLRWARYVPIRHNSGTNLDPEFVARTIWPLLQTGLGVPHGGQFELRTMSKEFLEFVPESAATRGYFPIRSDTMLEAHAEGCHPTIALKPLTLATFGHEMAEIMSLFPGKLTKFEKDSIRFSDLDQHDPAVYEYACEDSLWTLGHHYKRFPHIRTSLIYQMEMGILPIVCAMEDFGLQYDWLYMRDGALRGRAFQERLGNEISGDLTELLGESVKLNLASPKQVSEVLYDKLKLPVKRRSRKTNKPSTDKIALKALSGRHPIVQKMINWRQLAKLCGTYLEKYEKNYSYALDGRTHPHHMQCGVPAGRFAVSDPPYQQSPKKYHYELATGETFDFKFRNAIVAPPGYYGIGYDYSQMEVRVLAGEAGEMQLIEAFANGEDIHVKTASLMLGIPREDVDEDQRAIGKTLGLALGYQMGVDGLADRLGISLGEAQDLFDQYFAAYPRIKTYLEQSVAQAMRQGFIHTKFGRRVPIWDYMAPERWKRREAERLAGNAPIQGGAADYMKLAMIRADQALRKAGLIQRGVRLVMNIHDALEWYVPLSIPPSEIINALTKGGVVDEHPAILFPVEGWPPMEAEWHVWGPASHPCWGGAKTLEIHADGSIAVKGDRVEEFIPGDEDEEGPALPKVDLEAMRAARASSPPPAPEPGAGSPAGSDPGLPRVLSPYSGPPRTVVIESARPAPDQFRELLGLVETTPGPNHVILRMPDGDVPFGQACGLSPDHETDIAFLLGGAKVHYDAASVDAAAVASDLRL